MAKQTKQHYFLVYKNKDDSIKTYEIGRPDLRESFGNKVDGRNNVGFKAYCYGREDFRSFRHDRIVSLTRA